MGKGKGFLVLIFLLLLIYSIYNFLFSCKFFPRNTFDSQLLLFWDYTALHNLIPNKDILYPYGILFYYKNVSIIFSFIYVLLFPTLAILTLLTFKKIIKNKILIYLTFFSFIFFILKYTGIEVFNRYGILLGISVLLSFVYNKYLYVPRSYSFLFGCLIGFVLSIVTDIGLYILSLFLFFSFFIPIFNNRINTLKTSKYYIHLAFTVIFFLIGILTVLLPIVLFYMKLENLSTYVEHSKYLFDFQLYSKTPFLPSLRSTENIFNFVVIIFTVFVLSYKRIILKEKTTFITYIQISIIVSLFLLLQKSVIRSIDIQITFLAFILYMFLFLEIITFLKDRINTFLLYAYYLLALFILFSIMGLRSFNTTSIYFYKPLELSMLKGNIQSFLTHKQTICLSQNLDKYKDNKTYQNILMFINRNAQDKKLLIFDYLTDPIFYVLLNQKSPFYFEVFGSSPIYAQHQIVDELNKRNTDFVILNINMLRVKDNVPDYMRTYFLLKYITTSFVPVRKIGNYYILMRHRSKDFFESDFFKNDVDLQKYFLDIDLKLIPQSEGLYKSKYLSGSEVLVSGSLDAINQYLAKQEISENDVFLVVNSKEDTDKKSHFFTLETGDYLKTTVSFSACSKKNVCIVNLSRIPIFYKMRKIKRIYSEGALEDSFQLIRSKNKIFW